jgi:hypothetical protein
MVGGWNGKQKTMNDRGPATSADLDAGAASEEGAPRRSAAQQNRTDVSLVGKLPGHLRWFVEKSCATLRRLTERRAVTTIEYALVGGVVIISCAALVSQIGAIAAGFFTSILDSFR